ncbi:hypothetical protein HON36_05540 [Candidatus Parcubacteria bacterium]|mgnify:CR=1 FL=1|jgi:hypothetical protein|nr:hypothetical protein [Candidatus Parcubacteria bacterium]MBT7227937.1 hypothetical protein [Candidatus Parcubacteria bacterium]
MVKYRGVPRKRSPYGKGKRLPNSFRKYLRKLPPEERERARKRALAEREDFLTRDEKMEIILNSRRK